MGYAKPLNGATAALEEGIKDIQNITSGYDKIDYTIQSGYYITTTGVFTASESYHNIKVDCTAGDKLSCTTTTSGQAVAMAMFFDKDENKLSMINQGINAIRTPYVNYEFTVPVNACSVAITGVTALPIKLKKYQMIKAFDRINIVENNVSDLSNIVGTVSNKTESYWKNKNIVWFGTSIPCGTVTNNYPTMVANFIGANITNEAVGFSMARRGIASKTTTSDPYGWTGMAWENVAYALGQTLAEKHDLIDNWVSKWQSLLADNPPATLSAGTKNVILDCSYETKLVSRHLGANRKDLYIFDHGHNDNATVSNGDIVTMPTNTRDRGYFLGAMNYLIDLILADNPKARICFISEYENQQHPTTVQAQEMLASYWSYPLCNLADKLGWSQQLITTTSSWVNGVWTAGTTSKQLTIKQVWLPDDTHPHTDLSGSALTKITENLIDFINSVR
jgi:hypothetical protein